jgi:hypothetical protein
VNRSTASIPVIGSAADAMSAIAQRRVQGRIVLQIR